MTANALKTASLKSTSGDFPSPFLIESNREVVIGRDPGCQIVLDSNNAAKVSRRHAAIRFVPDRGVFVLSDLASANGTYVNGQLLQGVRALRSGDRVRLAKDGPELQFEDSSLPDTVVGNPRQNSPLPDTEIKPNPNPNGSKKWGVGSNPSQPRQNNTWKWVLGVVAVLFLGRLGNIASHVSSGGSPSVPAPSSQQPASANFGNFKTCPETANGICTDDVTTFNPATKAVQWNVDYGNVSKGTQIDLAIRNPSGREFKADPITTRRDKGTLGAAITLDRAWPVGEYQIIVSLHNNPASSLTKTFSISDSASAPEASPSGAASPSASPGAALNLRIRQLDAL